MKYVLGGMALIAAMIIVGCSATTLFLTAFNSVNEPWQQWLQGAGIAAIVAWEAAAVLIIGYCFKTRHWATGLGAVVLLVLAMAVTSRQELRLYLGGQADVTASRTVTADDRARVRAELERAYARRDTLQEKTKLTKFQEADLADVKTRIRALEERWDTQTIDVKASGHAEGDFARRLFGFDADLAQMFLDTLPLWFWMVARVFSISAAVAAIRAMWHESAKEARPRPEDDLGVIVVRGTVTAPPVPAPRVERRPLDGTLEKLTGAKANLPEIPVSSNLSASPISSPLSIDHKDQISPIDHNPDGPGTPVAKPEEPATEEPAAEDAKIVRPAQWHDESVPPVAPRTNGKRSKRNLTRKDQIVIQWLADSCSITGDERDLTTGTACHASYKQYCKGRGIPEHDWVAKARMSTILSGHLGTRVEGGRGKRTNQGAVFTGLLINPTVAQRRRVAA